MSQKGSLVRGISAEMQDMILSILIFDKDMYDATRDVMSEHFFYGEEYKTLFKALAQFHKTNKAAPTLKDMMINVSLILSNSPAFTKSPLTIQLPPQAIILSYAK